MVHVTPSEDGKRAIIVFEFTKARVERIQKLKPIGARFTGEKDGGPYWTLPLNLPAMRRLREAFGRELRLTDEMKAWGHEAIERERVHRELVLADDADLGGAAAVLLTQTAIETGMPERPYQRVDIKLMSGHSTVNTNQPGTGKTLETIGAVFEAGLERGRHLVVAPVTSLREVWEIELEAAYRRIHQEQPVVLTGDTFKQREDAIEQAVTGATPARGLWLLINPEMTRMKDGKLKVPALEKGAWDSITVDEFHLNGLSDTRTQTAKGLNRLARVTKCDRRYPLSGSPMDGKPIRLYGALHFIRPDLFTSKWDWARQWLDVEKKTVYVKGKARDIYEIGDIQQGREAEFEEHHRPFLVRRTKAEALPGLPSKVPIEVWCQMTKRQAKQYREFEDESEWRLDERSARVTANNVLAEYTRLKQFASAFQEVKYRDPPKENRWGMPMIELHPTADAGKIPRLLEKLAEEGVGDGRRALVFTQYVPMAAIYAEAVNRLGAIVEVVTGEMKQKDRPPIFHAFQEGEGADVLVMNHKVGGASLNLSRADSVHMMDETWRPSDQDQAGDRAHRGDELTMMKDEVRVYHYRCRGTIEADIAEVLAGKAATDKRILDLRRARAKRHRRDSASAV